MLFRGHPRMCGGDENLLLGHNGQRDIPACAQGEKRATDTVDIWRHPRVTQGERKSAKPSANLAQETSPRARGVKGPVLIIIDPYQAYGDIPALRGVESLS